MRKKRTRGIALLTAICTMLSAIQFPKAEAADAPLKDSGINYTEKVGTVLNPAMGYTSTVWAKCKPDETPIYSPTGSLVLCFIDIGAFSSGINGTTDDDGNYIDGIDYDLDETFFDAWRETFENCRNNGCMVALRFRYDANGKSNPEPATFEQVLHHVQQIKDSHLLEDYEDILAFVESGFVGAWGEQHSGKYTSVSYKAQLLDAMLNAVPESVPVTVRTPDTFAVWAGITRAELMNEDLYEAAMNSSNSEDKKLLSKRVGLYNDGYMGSSSDLGTFANREIETSWLNRVTTATYYGGEFSGNIEFAKQYDTYLPENAIPEMYKTHLSYINGNIFQLYKDYTFGAEYDVENVDNSAYYGQNVYQFIRDHLGYRFVLRKSELSDSVLQGGTLNLHFAVENTGFANPIPHTTSEIILEQDGDYIRVQVDLNANEWYSCTVNEAELSMKLPDSIRTGEWNVYLKTSMGDNTIGQLSMRSITFANEDIWNSMLGANYLGSFTVTETAVHGTDNYFYEIGNAEQKTGACYTINNQTVIDGLISYPNEWTEDMLIAENEDGQKIYIKADDSYLYVRAIMPEGASAPVYNLQLNNPEQDDEYYWLYYASSGYIHFNHDSYAGCLCKWNGSNVEFRLPFSVFGLRAGQTVNRLRVFLQDSGNGWLLMGDLRSSETVIPIDFTVYTETQDIRLAESDSFPLSVETSASDASYQWYLNDTPITGAVGQTYTITDAAQSDEGIYRVVVTLPNGFSKTVTVADLLEVVSQSTVRGDVNNDGVCSIADAVMLQQWLLGSGVLTNPTNADLDENTKINAVDLTILKQILLGFV